MKALASRLWNEPAVALGFLATVFLAVLNWATDNDWTADNIISIVTPLVSSLGIRQLVTPVKPAEHKQEPDKVPVG